VGQALRSLSSTLPTKPSQTTTSTGLLEEVVPLDVADEIDLGQGQFLVCSRVSSLPFRRLRADAHQADSRVLSSKHFRE